MCCIWIKWADSGIPEAHSCSLWMREDAEIKLFLLAVPLAFTPSPCLLPFSVTLMIQNSAITASIHHSAAAINSSLSEIGYFCLAVLHKSDTVMELHKSFISNKRRKKYSITWMLWRIEKGHFQLQSYSKLSRCCCSCVIHIPQRLEMQQSIFTSIVLKYFRTCLIVKLFTCCKLHISTKSVPAMQFSKQPWCVVERYYIYDLVWFSLLIVLVSRRFIMVLSDHTCVLSVVLSCPAKTIVHFHRLGHLLFIYSDVH